MGLSSKPYQRSGGPFSRGGGGGGGNNNGGGRGGGRNGGGGRGGGNNDRNGGDNRKAGRDNNRGGDRDNNNRGGDRNNNGRNGGGRGGGGGGGGNNNNGPRQQQGADVVGTLLKFMFERFANVVYNADSGMLNLAQFRESPDLSSAKTAIDFNNVAFCKSLVATIKNSSIGIPRFIDVSGNSISSPSNFFRALADEGMAGGIQGISLANNSIKDIGFAGTLSRFTNLTELSLVNNSINDPHYRRTLAKRIPSLTMLDGESIKRPPLGLPFPKHVALADDATRVLQYLEQALFSALAANNTQVLMGTYHPDAVFSCSTDDRFTISCQTQPGADKSIREDYASLKHALKDGDTNLSMRGAVNRMVKGRTQILAAQEKGLYHKKFLTHHTITGDANVSFLSGAAAPVPVAVATIHGKMMWLPKASQAETPRAALFDRTITLVPGEAGGYVITTDCVHLRRALTDEPLFFADSPSRVERLCKAFGAIYPPEIFAAMVNMCSNDREYYELRDNVPQAAIEQSYLACGSDPFKCVRIAKLCVIKGCDPQTAMAALEAVGYDMARV